MTDDIVTRLRAWHTEWDWYLPDQAADEIERLGAEIEQLSKRPPHMHPVGDLCVECDYYGTRDG